MKLYLLLFYKIIGAYFWISSKIRNRFILVVLLLSETLVSKKVFVHVPKDKMINSSLTLPIKGQFPLGEFIRAKRKNSTSSFSICFFFADLHFSIRWPLFYNFIGLRLFSPRTSRIDSYLFASEKSRKAIFCWLWKTIES